jgi:CHRD domain
MYRRSVLAGAILAAAGTTISATYANAQEFRATLSGFQEVGALNAETGAIFSKTGEGTLKLKLDEKAQSLTYTLTYSGLTSNVLQAHIHFGKVHVPGGIFLFLCTNLGNGPAGTPACPNPSATGSNAVTGMLTPASVLAVPGQNIVAGDFSIVPAALKSDTAYGNVHTNNFKAGEIRGQIRQPENENQQGQNQNQQ